MTPDPVDPIEVVVLDTSALLYWTLAPERLTAPARAYIDPADRWITALAMRRESPLITSDRTIRDYYHREVW